jgi:hypothetical protein
MRRIWFVFLVLSLCTLVGCSTIVIPKEEDSILQKTIEIRSGVTPLLTEIGSSPTLEENQEQEIMVGEPTDSSSYDPALEPLVSTALEDLSERLGAGIDQIKVIDAELVVWPDASLGCPQPGMVYAQVLVEGTLIRLGIGDQVYDYHGGGDNNPFLCEDVIKVKPTTPKIDITIRTPPPRDMGDR